MNVMGFLKRKLFVSAAVWILLSALAVTTIYSADGPISIKITDAYFKTNEEDNIINEKYLVLNGEISQKIKDEISFYIIDADKKVTDVLQTVSDENGKFSFKSTFDRTNSKGKYTVRISSAMSANITEREIAYSGINGDAEITSFKIDGVSGSIKGDEITVKFDKYVDLKKSTAEFVTSDDAKVYVGGTRQKSGESKNDFTKTVEYKVVSEDNSNTKTYSVKCDVPSGNNVSSGGSGGGGGSASGVSHMNYNGVKDELKNDDSTRNENVFGDVKKDNWAYEYINALYREGIVNGDEKGMFYPENNITREEFVKMLVNALKLKTESDIEQNFDDVDSDSWYAPFVKTAYFHKIVNGVSATSFGTGMNITREDMAVMAYRCMFKDTETADESKDAFADDSEISDYAKAAVYSMKEKGIIGGTGEGLFEPKRYSERAEAAKIIYNCINLKFWQRGDMTEDERFY